VPSPTTAGSPPGLVGTAPIAEQPGRYLREYDLFRVVTFVCVIGQHSILWPVTSSSVAGWGIVMLLHYTRNAFFFLSAFVAYYAQSTRPRTVSALWYRRLSQVLVPYLAWTAIYYAYTRLSGPTPDAWGTLGHDLYKGYYQLYFLVVLIQFYVLLPALRWLIRVTRRHHVALLSISLAWQMAMTVASHYAKVPHGWEHRVHAVDTILIQSRWLTGYQFYVIAGLVAAAHADELHRFADRHVRAILIWVGSIGIALEGYYLIDQAVVHNPGHAADLYQPTATVWFCAAILGLIALGRLWARREARGNPTRLDRTVEWLATASGGIYLAHVLVLQLIDRALKSSGATNDMSWVDTSWILFFGTLAGATVLVGLFLHTPLRFILTGPNRSEQRHELRPDYGGLAPTAPSLEPPQTAHQDQEEYAVGIS
jgi:peptidoglycan/LPS O-acetylase OafA/YrhL